MEHITTIIEDYKRRLQTIKTEIHKGGDDLTIQRYNTKASCYRTIIAELERIDTVENRNEILFNFLDHCDGAGWIKNIDKKRIVEDYSISH